MSSSLREQLPVEEHMYFDQFDEEQQRIFTNVILAMKAQFESDCSGHDFAHLRRVTRLAYHIAKVEGADVFTVVLSAYLHDISDHKLNGGKLDDIGNAAAAFLESMGASASVIEKVVEVVTKVTYKGAGVADKACSLEGQCVRDGDRLDAIGYIGIARTFAYGGNRNSPMFDPACLPTTHASFEAYANSKSTTVNHFYEKLLLLKDRLVTNEGKRIGEKRHKAMLGFLEGFFDEWDFGGNYKGPISLDNYQY